jgi:hypothetical protein
MYKYCSYTPICSRRQRLAAGRIQGPRCFVEPACFFRIPFSPPVLSNVAPFHVGAWSLSLHVQSVSVNYMLLRLLNVVPETARALVNPAVTRVVVYYPDARHQATPDC